MKIYHVELTNTSNKNITRNAETDSEIGYAYHSESNLNLLKLLIYINYVLHLQFYNNFQKSQTAHNLIKQNPCLFATNNNKII